MLGSILQHTEGYSTARMTSLALTITVTLSPAAERVCPTRRTAMDRKPRSEGVCPDGHGPVRTTGRKVWDSNPR